MDYYARLLELLALLPPERQADMIRGLELLLEVSAHALFCQGGKRRNVKIFIQTYSL